MSDPANKKMNVESFNLDHTKVVAPYIRVADVKTLSDDVEIVKFDLRFTQPNDGEPMTSDSIHSLEHMFAEASRNHSDRVIDFSPMGCKTGFYLTMYNTTLNEAVEVVKFTLAEIISMAEVPAANEVQCGNAALHSLRGAKREASMYLNSFTVMECQK